MSKKYNYRKLKPKEYAFIKHNINDIYAAAEFYEKVFINKKVIFYTKNTVITVIASITNFMHLCGIFYLRGSRNFFKDAQDKKIDLSKVLVKKDGTTFQKLQVLNLFPELISGNIRLTTRGHFLLLDYDYALRTSKRILALTLLSRNANVVPQSILNLHRIKKFDKGEPVIKIESQKFNSEESTILFVRKQYHFKHTIFTKKTCMNTQSSRLGFITGPFC